METGPDEYRDQIEEWMETICEKTFGDAEEYAGVSKPMKEENLGNSISFMVDALLTDDCEYREIDSELMDAALRITQIAWNAEVRGDAVTTPRAPVLRPGIRVDDAVWKRLILGSSQELVNLMRKRKQFFFPDDTRLIRRCFCNMFGTISIEEENEDGKLHVGR